MEPSSFAHSPFVMLPLPHQQHLLQQQVQQPPVFKTFWKEELSNESLCTSNAPPSSVEFEYVAEILLALKSASLNQSAHHLHLSSKRSRLSANEEDPRVETCVQTESNGLFEDDDDQGSEEDESDDFSINEEEDDDEWFDSASSRSSACNANMNRRKKTPSGTACIAHKRWKKRCPDDCQMRPSEEDDESHSFHHHQSSHYLPAEDACDLMDQEDSQGEGEVDDESAQDDVQSHSGSDSDQFDYFDHRSYADFINKFQKKSPSQNSNSSSEESSNGGDTQKSSSPTLAMKARKRAWGVSTVACSRHTDLHARCPPNCSDRRPAKPHPRSKKTKQELASVQQLPYQNYGSSPLQSPQQPQQLPEIQQRKPRKHPVLQQDEIDLLPTQLQKQISKRNNIRKGSPSTMRKANSSTSRNGRTGRKYLPQACDRHKVLHARCPANCPDRLKRDADLHQSSDEDNEN